MTEAAEALWLQYAQWYATSPNQPVTLGQEHAVEVPTSTADDVGALRYGVIQQQHILRHMLAKLGIGADSRDTKTLIQEIDQLLACDYHAKYPQLQFYRVALHAAWITERAIQEIATSSQPESGAAPVHPIPMVPIPQDRKPLSYAERFDKRKSHSSPPKLNSETFCSPMLEEDLCPPQSPEREWSYTKPKGRITIDRSAKSKGPVGRTVVLHNGLSGIVRFAGCTEFASGEWLGIELFEPQGKHFGTVKGVKYFSCVKNRRNRTKFPYGIFVRETQIKYWEPDLALTH